MQIKIFSIPLLSGEQVNEQMNAYLRANRIVNIEKQLCEQNGINYWTFCITSLEDNKATHNDNIEKHEKVDYKEILDENAFATFSILRSIRKQMANEEGIPAYMIFTDVELAEISRLEKLDEQSLSSLKGVGVKRVEKYGKEILLRYFEQQNKQKKQ